MDLAAGQTLLHYRLVAKVGEGGMGVVWRATDTRLGRDVAIKFLPDALAGDAERLARFEREARVLATLNHPGVVVIHAVEQAAGAPFLVMEYVDGAPLSARIPPQGMAAADYFDVAVQLADAVAAAHRQGVTHRDLKPSNVVVAADGRVKVLDFGLAKLVAGDTVAEDPQQTRTRDTTAAGTVLGTVAYMSPEQVDGRPSDARTDVFALGVVLHEMATGSRPFLGASAARIVSSILRDDPQPIKNVRPDLPADLGRIVLQCLEKEPDRRFQNAQELRDRIQAVVEERRLGPGRPVAAPRPQGAWWIVPAALIVAAGALGLWLGRDSGPRDTGQGADPAPAARTMSQLTFGAEMEQWPAWSPDGRRLIYTSEVGGFAKLFLRDPEAGSDRQLTEGSQDDIQPTWSPDGRSVAFVRSRSPRGKLEPSEMLSGQYLEGDVWLLDLASGEATRIVETAFNPVFSPDGTRIAVDASWAGPRRVWTTDARGRNPRQVTTDTSEAVSHTNPSWSPDARRIVFQHNEKTILDVRVVDADTGATASITDDLYPDLDPAWAGDAVYFSSYRGGGWNVWRIPVTAAGAPTEPPEQLTTGAGQDIQPSPTPAGDRLAFTVLSQNADLWRLPVDPVTAEPTGPAEPLIASSREDSRGAFSPDGRTVAFNSDRDGDMNIWVYAVADGSTRPLTRGPGGDFQPRWAPDGRTLVFFSTRSGNADVWTVDVAGGQPTRLTDDPALDVNPFFSPDGKSIAFHSDRDGRKEVWAMNADGSLARQLSRVGAADHFLRWSDDGAWIHFRSTTLAQNGVCRVPLAGGEAEPLGVPVGWHMSFSPDRASILDALGHKALWIYALDGADPRRVFGFDDLDARIDYPDWSSDGRQVVFDRVVPRGGDVWQLEGLGR